MFRTVFAAVTVRLPSFPGCANDLKLKKMNKIIMEESNDLTNFLKDILNDVYNHALC